MPSRCSSPPARDAVHPWHAIAARARRSPAPAATRSSTPEQAEANLARRAGARPAQGPRADGDQHPCLLPRRPALRGRSAWPTPSATAASRQRPGRPASPPSSGSAPRPSRATRPPTGRHPHRAAAPALVDPGFARFRGGRRDARVRAGRRQGDAGPRGRPPDRRRPGRRAGRRPSRTTPSTSSWRPTARRSAADEPADGPRPPRPCGRPARCRWRDVEPAAEIVRRFVSSAMSLGALSPEAHRALAIGMRRLGGDLELRRGRRGSGLVRARRERRARGLGDQAGRLGSLRRDGPVPRPGRAARDQDGPGQQARRGRPAPGEEGDAPDRGPAPRPGRA